MTTLSQVPLALLCGASLLEGGQDGGKSAASRTGDRAHDEIAKAFETRTWPTEGYAYQAYLAVRSSLMSEIDGYKFFPEMAIAFDREAKLSRVLGFNIGRDYAGNGVTEIDVAGTVDLLCVNEKEKHAVLLEWGTGFDIGHKRHQLEAQAGVLAHIPGQWLGDGWVFDLVLVQLSESSWDMVHSATHKGLDSLKGCMGTLHMALEAPRTETPGEHCTKLYCKRIHSCGAMSGASRTLALATGVHPTSQITVANAGAFRRALQIGKKWIASKEDELKALARKEPVILENGKRYLPIMASASRMNTSALEALARAKGATDEEIEGCRRVDTFEQFREVNHVTAEKKYEQQREGSEATERQPEADVPGGEGSSPRSAA